MPHISVRDQFETVDELYSGLQGLYVRLERRLAVQLLVSFGLLVVALTLPGAWAKAALCLAILGGMGWVWTLADLVGLNWFMHRITLHDLFDATSAPGLGGG